MTQYDFLVIGGGVIGLSIARELKARHDEARIIDEALNKGLSKAYSICQKGLINGAFIVLQGRVVWTDSLNSLLAKL